MSINTSYGQSDLFGHADYYMNREAGYSDSEIMQWINANPSKLSVNRTGPNELVQQIATGARMEEEQEKLAEANRLEIERQEQLQLEAEAKQAEKLKQMEISERVKAANAARAGMESQFQIKSASKSPQTSGTQGFKRRQLQINPTSYNAISAGAQSLGVLNV